MLWLVAAGSAMGQGFPVPENPATGIWIQQVGDIIPQASSKATLYYTKYEYDKNGDRVKGISYQYNGAGYLLMKPTDKKTVCSQGDGVGGADGIVEHPDGDLLIAGQGQNIYKVNKTAGPGKCVVKTSTPAQSTSGFWHLMMDPTQKILWGAGIPGYLFRFSTDMKAGIDKNFANKGYKVTLKPHSSNRRKDDKLATIIWDGEGTAFFTYSDYMGGGCEADGGKKACSASARKSSSAGAYFGYFSDTTKVKVTKDNIGTYGGSVGDSVISAFETKILIDSLEGAHGGTYDEYSKTIFVFGGSKIVQIKPYREKGQVKAKVVASIDLREYFFEETSANLSGPRTPGVGWRLDQGTVDGYGHLFVASNTGHIIFVDYAANPQLLINDNVLIHVQWVDNYLDDVAPLKGVIVGRDSASTGNDKLSSSSMSSSSLVEYEESSSSNKSSSSNGKSSSSVANPSSSSDDNSGKSSSSNKNSSSSVGGGSGSSSGTSSGISSGTSSGNTGSSSSVTGGGKSSSSGKPDGSSSSSVGGTSSGTDEGGSGKSSSSNGSGDSDKSSSSKGNGGGNGSEGSSSSKNVGAGDEGEPKSSSSREYFGAEDYEVDDESGFDRYPSAEDFEKGDSVVSNVVVLEPVKPDPNNPNIIIIDGNSYLLSDDPTGLPMDLHYDSGRDSAKVGEIVAITLDSNKVKEFFGNVDSLKIVSENVISILNPQTGNKEQSIKVNADGSVTIFVTSSEAIKGGAIKIYGDKEMLIIDNINFYDPIPDTRVGYIKDTDGDLELDYVEILLTDSLSPNYKLENVWLVVNGDTLKCAKPKLNDDRDRILVDVSELKLPSIGKFPDDAKALVAYSDKAGTGAVYYRESPIVEVGSNVIKDAYAIRNAKGMDSLFLQFNIDLIPKDVGSPEMLVMLKQNAGRYGFDAGQIKKVYMPAKDIIILVGKDFGLKGKKQDSVSLYPNVTFENLPYITSDEYEREVPVSVSDRFASAKNVEYWDTDGDGVLDQIVTVFDSKLTPADIEDALYMSFPWYSNRGMLIQLQAQPSELIIDSEDPTRVIWNVHSTTKLATGVTSISEGLPEANIYTYYSVFGETFVNEGTAPLVDKMAPVVSSATLSYGSRMDTLVIVFSEAIMTKGLKGDDFFSYIHGNEVIELDPKSIEWSADGFTAKLILDGESFTIMPGDSLLVRKGEFSVIKDNYGNIAGENPQPVIIGGLLNHLVESTNMGSFDVNDDRVVEEGEKENFTLQTVSSVNLRYVPGSTTKKDLEKEGALGQLVQLGERFVPQLLDRAHVSADGSYDPSVLDSLKPEDVYISFIVNYFDHIGQYVNDTIITVPCNSPKFGGNCLETDKKVFVNWNFKDHKGRFVGTGVYNVQFKMIVKYENKRIEEEIKDKWGVRRRKGKK